MIPRAEATGRCEIRPLSTVFRVETDAGGRASEVRYFDEQGREQAQRAKAVVVCGNGAETARLLLMSASNRFPQGLANSSGNVGKYLMFNGNTGTAGSFEHPLNEFKSVQATRVVHEWYNADSKRGFYGGGGLDARFQFYPILFGLFGLPPGSPSWGSEYKRLLGQYFNHTMQVAGHSTSLPVESNSISLDPRVADKWGRPAMRVTYRDHADDVKMMAFLVERAKEVLDAAGATRVWDVFPAQEQTAGAHLLGTCRMGNDERESVVDRYHRAHDVPNLFICDGSSFVTSGRGQPTMTIMALAFRAAEHITRFARRGEI